MRGERVIGGAAVGSAGGGSSTASRCLTRCPCWPCCFETLQIMGELMENTALLDKAAATEDPYERCAQ